MGSQSFEILRQGVWASLTGGWFYDPHQTVFCNIIHLYLWLFLLCGPFTTYLYFPSKFISWTVYCIFTTLTVTFLKIFNMALHLLYDKAQAVSEFNLKIGTKEKTFLNSEEGAIEMQVIENEVPSKISFEKPINEVSEGNSIISIDHVTSTIDLKVDVHRKNSSESSDSLSMYSSSLCKNIKKKKNSSNQNSLNLETMKLESTETSKLKVSTEEDFYYRLSENLKKSGCTIEKPSKEKGFLIEPCTKNSKIYMQIPLKDQILNQNCSQVNENLDEILLEQKCTNLTSTQFSHGFCSLYKIEPALESSYSFNDKKQTSDNERKSTYFKSYKTSSTIDFELPKFCAKRNLGNFDEILIKKKKLNDIQTSDDENNDIRKNNMLINLQKNGYSEPFDELQNRVTEKSLIKSGLCARTNFEQFKDKTTNNGLQMVKSMKNEINISEYDKVISAQNESASSEMYFNKRNHKSELDIDNVDIDQNLIKSCSDSKTMHNLLFKMQNDSVRPNSKSSMSILQFTIDTSNLNVNNQRIQNKRRHSNINFKTDNKIIESNGTLTSLKTNNVRRIKSTALDLACQQSSVFNLRQHPNSTEALGTDLQYFNSSLLPPPSKCLVRNHHLTFCSKFNENYEETKEDKEINVFKDDLKSPTKKIMGKNYSVSQNKDQKIDLDSKSHSSENNIIKEDKIKFSSCKRYEKETKCISKEDEIPVENKKIDEKDLLKNFSDDGKNYDGNKSENNNYDYQPSLKLNRFSNSIESKFEIERSRTLSTDSETDNNGSRSPLLNKSKKHCDEPEFEILQQSNLTFVKSDNSQISTMNKSSCCASDIKCCDDNFDAFKPNLKEVEAETFIKNKKDDALINILYNVPLQRIDIAQEEADIENFRIKDSKNLGAIPKRSLRRCSENSCITGIGGFFGSSNMNVIPLKRATPKPISRTSSSGSSHSFSTEGFPNDNYKTYKDRYSFTLSQERHHGLPFSSCFANGLDDTNEDVGNFRLQNRLNFGDVDNSVNINFRKNERNVSIDSGTTNLKLEQNFKTGNANLQQYSDTTNRLSIQGLINDQNSYDNSITSTADHNNTCNRNIRQASAGILNVEINDSLYCDYWRSCRLSTEQPVQPKKLYKYNWKFLGKHELKVTMDRLQLLALFDRDLNWLHVILAIFLSGLICFLGSYILQLAVYKDIRAFIFCLVIAGSQYSLLKSVQPDAASPIHGFNKTVAYSRPIYFCLCSSLLILSCHLNCKVQNNADYNQSFNNNKIFGIPISINILVESLTNFLSIFLLLLPIFFSLGFFPQINTFCMYLLEQIDMHIFGGNAVCSLASSFLCIIKSFIAVSMLYGPVFGSLSEQKGTRHFLFSFFCSLLIPLSYHLSRSASDFSYIWKLIKSVVENTIPYEDDEECVVKKEKKISNHVLKTINLEEFKNNNDCTEKEQSSYKLRSLQTISPSHIGNEFTVKSNSSIDSKVYNNNVNTENVSYIEPKSGARNDLKNAKLCTEELSMDLGDSNILSNDFEVEQTDPLPQKLQSTVNSRLKNDLVVSTILGLLVFSLHCSTIFTILQPDINTVLYIIAGFFGFFLHYILPQMRKHMPWLCFSGPILKQKEYGQFEVSSAAKVMWFEAVYVIFSFLERNILYPLIFISALTAESHHIAQKFGISCGSLIISICSLKCVRNAYSDPGNQYLILIFSILLFKVDFDYASETFIVNYFVVSILFKKSCDFLLKLQFIVTYIAPWQITWGSAFHAFAQPFSVPHSAMLFVQAGISAVLSTPLNPFLGSAIFLSSYVRPIKFWERDYKTRRIDHSNTRLSSQLERDLGADDNNLNSIFYEHLTRSLQHSLCGDLLLGRWGTVSQGDCFVLASDYLNCLVHIIELGNGLCTFQMRGLEFRGTYCQQREVEAISEGVEDNDACCCCNPGHIPKMLSANAMFSTRWLAWQVVASQYVIEGYSISENLATATLQPFEFRKVLITYYMKCIIYYVTNNSNLQKWLASNTIRESLSSTLGRQFVDLDPIFNYNLDEDFDFRALGITRSSFCATYLSWIQLCYKKRKNSSDSINLLSNENNTPNLNIKHEPTCNNNENNEFSKNNFNYENVCDRKNQCDMQVESFQLFNSTSSNNIKIRENFLSAAAPAEIRNNEYKNLDTYFLQEEKSNKIQTSGILTRRSSVRCRKKINKRRFKFNKNSHIDPVKTKNDLKLETSDIQSSISKDSSLVSLCLALGLLARRSLATASHSSLSGVEFFLHGLHALFKGDFRITSPRDEWVFADMELLHGVVAPAVKMALKLHQDHFSSPDEYLDPMTLYNAMSSHTKELVISHEADPIWRNAVLRGAPNLLALRHVMEDGSDEYRIIRLTKRFLSFRVIKLNRECVRGLWAGQQQELIYLRNRNPERGSIQNAKQALRNIINSSCDQPIGYPIYVSPLTTSYADTNEQISRIIGGALTFESIKCLLLESWRKIRRRCREGCSSGSAGIDSEGVNGSNDAQTIYLSPIIGTNTIGFVTQGNQTISSAAIRGSLGSMSKPSNSNLLNTLLKRDLDQDKENLKDGKSNNIYNKKNQCLLITKETDVKNAFSSISTRIFTENLHQIFREFPETANEDILKKFDISHNEISLQLINGSNCLINRRLEHKTNREITNSTNTIFEFVNISSSDRSNVLNESETFKEEEKICQIQILKKQAIQPCIDLNKKALIVDESEIVNDLNLKHKLDLIWPNNKFGINAEQTKHKKWCALEGMIGYVRHFWLYNHKDPNFRSNVVGIFYLIEIKDHCVLVGDCGIREYNKINSMTSSLNKVDYVTAIITCKNILNSFMKSKSPHDKNYVTCAQNYNFAPSSVSDIIYRNLALNEHKNIKK